MGKKRPFLAERRAQITIFMILGFLLLLIFLFLMQVASQAEKSQFLNEHEKAFTKAFKKESLRLFVDDCLQDELEQGLILLGKQGTLWADQPGGTKPFSEGINGFTYSATEKVGEFSSGRIAYAITNETYFEYPQAFPCNEELNPPVFCLYQYPNTQVGFGNTKLFSSTFTQDLRQYLRERTAWCVQNFILTDISQHAEIVPTDMELDLTINDEGINVKVNYPLKFKVGGEEIFSLSTFDFFYPSHFKKLLDDVTTFALAQDQKLVDFNFTSETFAQPIFTYSSEKNVGPCTFDEVAGYFSCERAFPVDAYQSLGITMATESLPNGDDIFTFTPALYEIVNNPEPYSLRIARQNRPPALDYIQRDACPTEGYDYLVIKNDAARGDINLIPHAIDADEDRFSFSFSSELGTPVDEVLYRPAASVAAIPNDLYTVKVTATDEQGKEDKQDVRILVDRPIQLGLSLAFPEEYGVASQIGSSNRYVVSKEDPIIMNVIIPEESLIADPETLTFNYNDGREQFNFGAGYREIIPSTQLCYNLPLQEGEQSTCNVLYYDTPDKFTRINDPSYYDFPPFQRLTSSDSPGQLTFNFHQDYCGLLPADADSSIEVLVTDCVPLRNPEHPWAYPNQDLLYSSFNFETQTGECVRDGAGKCIKEAINPFKATHSCCAGNPADPNPTHWRIKGPEDDPCFVNPELGCYGLQVGFTSGNENKGYLLEQQKQLCNRQRGNKCEGTFISEFPNHELRCGTNGQNECRRIAPECQDKPAFSIVEGQGWCHGKMGCADFCSIGEEVVYTGTEQSRYFPDDTINSLVKDMEPRPTDENEFTGLNQFHCNCQIPRGNNRGDDGQPCDANFDGRFSDAVCDGGECKEKICPPNVRECNGDTETNYLDWRVCSSLGTEYSQSDSCGADEYCGENGECKPQICTPKELKCYPEYLSWVNERFPDYVDEVEADTQENPERENYPFFCSERGSGFNDIEAACSPECNAGVTVVEVADEEWRCGVCRESDSRRPNNKRCLKDGVNGECQESSSGRGYECR